MIKSPSTCELGDFCVLEWAPKIIYCRLLIKDYTLLLFVHTRAYKICIIERKLLILYPILETTA